MFRLKSDHTLVLTGDMSVVDEVVSEPTIEFKSWEGNWTWPQALEAEFGWMKEADQCLLGHGRHPVTWERFVDESERNGERRFKAIEQRKPPEETFMGLAIVVWSRTQVTALRHVGWVSDPMIVSGGLLKQLFEKLPIESHVDLVLETYEVREAIQACADIITQGLDKEI
jgi:hypothetical protein